MTQPNSPKKRWFPKLRLRSRSQGSGQGQGDLATAIRQREQARLQGRLGFLKSQWLYQVYTLVPPRFRWLLPWLRDYLPGVGLEDEAEGAELAATTAVATEQPLSLLDPFLLPPLEPGVEILGQRGRYQVEALVKVRGRGRLYRGVDVGSGQPVSIREYGLPPQQFSSQEVRQRQQAFRDRGGINLADGRPEHFRLVQPYDAIPDERQPRCYLVSVGETDLLPTLGEVLRDRGAWTERQVRRWVDQGLQTLESLHGQKFALPAGNVKAGLVHGNLSLDSVLIADFSDPAFAHDPQFFVYLTDLAVWDTLFMPPNQEHPSPNVADDLAAIAQISYWLLRGNLGHGNLGHGNLGHGNLGHGNLGHGNLAGGDSAPDPSRPGIAPTMIATTATPYDAQSWPWLDPKLRDFLWRLLGLTTPFPSAEAARRALPADWQVRLVPPEERAALKTTATRSRRRWVWWLLLLAMLGLLGAALWWWTRRQTALAQATTEQSPQLCCLDAATGVPRGKFRYAGDRTGTGTYIFKQPNLVLQGTTLEDELETHYSKLVLTYQPTPSTADAIQQLQQGNVDFALSMGAGTPSPRLAPTTEPLSGSGAIIDGLQVTPVAWDALVAFVPFSYERRSQGLPRGLQGRLTFQQLRQLYTGQIMNWRELGGPNLPVQLYVPTEPEAIALFEQRVLQDELTIAEFRRRLDQASTPLQITNDAAPPMISLPTFQILQATIRDFEEYGVGGIGFGALSRVFGQCAVYPLALQAEAGQSVQAVVRDQNGEAINPSIDLCADKGSYRRNWEAIISNQYPLSYTLNIVYPYDNSRPPIGRKISEILRSHQSQKLLEQAGLVPVESPTEMRESRRTP